MNVKTATWGGMTIGSLIGSFIPVLWGDNPFSVASVIFTAIGGIAGIVIGYKMAAS